MMQFFVSISRTLVFAAVFFFSLPNYAAQSPYQIFKTKAAIVKGTIMLLPAEIRQGSNMLFAKQNSTLFFTDQGYDVVLMAGQLDSLLSSYRHLTSSAAHKLRSRHIAVVGIHSGASLAAALLARLEPKEQPEKLLLIAPIGFTETLPGTVLPSIMPPLFPVATLFCLSLTEAHSQEYNSAKDYVKRYIGYGGRATEKQLSNITSKFKLAHLPVLFPDFFKQWTAANKVLQYPIPDLQNPAAIAVGGYSKLRHAEKVALIAKEKFNLILIGNSITNNFEKSAYQGVWKQFFAPRKAINLGFSGYRTENLLWNIDHGELDGQSPKVIIVEIGTNNVDEKNYPTRHTAQQLAGGIAAIVKLIRLKLPATKIILMRCFPGSYDGPKPTSHRAILERASDLIAPLADNDHVFYCDVNHVFLNLDGSINHQLMGDYLHPTPAGAKAWVQAMEPLLSQLMGDTSLDDSVPSNTAIVPVPRLEMDSYNWYDRHAAVLSIKDSINPEIVQIGNSITHFWGGLPVLRYPDGKLRSPNGPKSYAALFRRYRVLNMGFGWDRTQNVLWRLDHGELDGLHPRVVIVNIGTNNTSETENARMNTPTEIVEGISAICARVRAKVPGARIVVMAVFPREEEPTHPRRILIRQINKELEAFASNNQLTFLDIGPELLQPDGKFLPGVMLDFTHPSEKGYQIWADALRPILKAELLR